ncbi:hypothetical protein R3I94_006775 [Phoxinus phoxinus]
MTESPYTGYSGTDLYCPPKYRAKGDFHGKAATVWSLGILLFRILCGYFPDSYDLDQYEQLVQTWLDRRMLGFDLLTSAAEARASA